MSNLLGDENEILSLDNIRNVLIRLEDTIIFCMPIKSLFSLDPGAEVSGQLSSNARSMRTIPNSTSREVSRNSRKKALTVHGLNGS